MEPNGVEEGKDTGTGGYARGPSGLVDTWLGLVAVAASVTEQELAIGVRAAEFLERRLLDLSAMASSGPAGSTEATESWSRDVLDLFTDLLKVTVTPVPNRDSRLKAGGEDSTGGEGGPAGPEVMILPLPGPLTPGQAGERVLELSNEGATATGPFGLRSSDLITASGGRIEAENVYFEPSTLSVEPQGTGAVVVGVRIPKGTPGGKYEGLLTGTPEEGGERIIVQVFVD